MRHILVILMMVCTASASTVEIGAMNQGENSPFDC